MKTKFISSTSTGFDTIKATKKGRREINLNLSSPTKMSHKIWSEHQSMNCQAALPPSARRRFLTHKSNHFHFVLIIFPQTKRKRKTEDERKHKFFRVKFSLARLEMDKKSLEQIQLRLSWRTFGGGSSRKVFRPKYWLLIGNYFRIQSSGGFWGDFWENFVMICSFRV